MRFRGTTIRRKIVALLLIPLVSLTTIWAFAATLTGRAVFGRPNIQRVTNNIGYPTNEVVSSLQQERRVALVYVANTRDSQARIAYNKQEQTTDAAVAKLRTQLTASGIRKDLNSRANGRLDVFLNTVEGLTSLRQRIDNGRITRNDTYDAYNSLLDPAWLFYADVLPLTDVTQDGQRRAGLNLSRAREDLSRQDALMAAAISTGHMSKAEFTSFTFAVAQERGAYDDNLPVMDGRIRTPYDVYWQGDGGKNLRKVQDAVVAAGPDNAALTASHLQWQTVAASAFDDIGRINAASTASFYKKARSLPTTLLVETSVVAGLGLIAVVATLIVSVRIGRSLIRDLTGLRREAQEVSGTRLPRVMRRLASGEQVDVETEVPRLQYADDEIGQVGKALNTLQRAAVEAAVRQADMRKGVSDVFVNLARRSQVLLHRQLTLLDAMERRTENSEELADLFRLDHMTTRMRRHAEGLVILSGAAPSRQWRKPVQLMDVVRAAVAEVEDYERIEVRRLPRMAVTGSAVADLTHLLAELIENAAVFSPPHTQVRLHGEPVANGFVLEIDDRGLGLTPDALLEANLRLAETPEFELSDTDRLGLFVVSRLAQRQGVRVSLRQSPYGGTTAVVLIPSALLNETGDDTGSNRIEDLADPVTAERGGDPEHTFRQWGLDGVGDESQKEHVAHPDEPSALPVEDPELDGPLPRRRRRAAPVLVTDNGRQVGGGRHGRHSAPPQPEPPTAAQGVPAYQPEAAAQIPPFPAPRSGGGPGLLPGGAGGPATSGASGPAGPGSQAGPQAGTGPVLPRRVRQASLAPQLREVPTDSGPGADGAGARERSADEVRDRMAALQRGWQRGRQTADPEPGHGPHPGSGDQPSTSVPRTTPEGNGR
ncbi:MAG: nitrate- and nitrite sensing domain-containing protein [Actinomycetia bacterium]|nr:nitrate- and nitrite sensing domain-containing protein [Actinomycetes bacterium]